MLCDICGIRKAIIHFKQVINNQSQTIHVCEECAEERGWDNIINLPKSIPDLFEFLSSIFKEEKEAIEDKCLRCGMELEELKKKGRFGCSDCFSTFKQFLLPLFKQIHNSTHHIGRYPSAISEIKEKKNKIEELKKELKKAIETENYEEAARIRDMIKAIEC